jgi:hypothetical protein
VLWRKRKAKPKELNIWNEREKKGERRERERERDREREGERENVIKSPTGRLAGLSMGVEEVVTAMVFPGILCLGAGGAQLSRIRQKTGVIDQITISSPILGT